MKKYLFGLTYIAFLAGCDPAAPSASGVIDTSVDTSPFSTLEIRFQPMTPDPDTPMPYRQSWPLDEIQFPFDYVIGGDIGTSQVARWEVAAWLSATATASPSASDPQARREVDIGKCTSGCPGVDGIDLTLVSP